MRLFVFLLVLLPCFSYGQMLNPVDWSFEVNKVNEEEYELIFQADMDKNWNVYSQFIDEGGPFPTTITYETESVDLVGASVEEGHRKEGMDPIFEMNVIKFLSDEPYIIRQKIKKEAQDVINGYLTFMTCDDKRCLPPTDIEFSFNLNSQAPVSPKDEDKAQIDNTLLDEIPETKEQVAAIKGLAPTAKSPEKTLKKITATSNSEKKDISWIKAPEDNRPVQWSYGLEKIDETNYLLKFKAEIDKGWNVYSQFIDEGGPFPTTIYYENKDGVTLEGLALESGKKKEGMDPIFDMNVVKFFHDKPYIITQSIKVNDPSLPLTGILTYMSCDDEKCLPPTDIEFSFDLVNGIAGIESTIQEGDAAVAGLEGKVVNQIRPKLRESFVTPLSDCGEASKSNNSIILMFFFGFLGGLLALLTPCVFPMIPLTVSFFTKDTKRKGWWNGTIYGLSIIIIYVTIGFLITALFGEEALNSLSTNWIANTLFFLIFVFFAFSFFGFYEITLPSSWVNNSDKMADRGGLIGIFFMAFTLSLVSFSCTGPLIGTALVQAASNQVGPFVVMFGFSLALALPFGLFAAFPAWLNTLPKSGGWMNSVKVILGFLELALAFKFLTVADLTSHWGLLKYEVFLGIWILIALAMAAYGMGWIKFPHDSPVNRISLPRWIFSLSSLLFAIYLATGFTYNEDLKSYNPLGALSGLAPPVGYNLFFRKNPLWTKA